MLAYLFWHCPGPEVGRDQYERQLRGFHADLADRGYRSAAFRLEQLPFAERDGYEDWYLVDGWSALGALNEAAVDARSKPAHDEVAWLSRHGWGALYRLLSGDPDPPRGARWLEKPLNVGYDAFAERLSGASAWRRQLVLGPAPEFCVEASEASGREPIWPR